MEDFNGQAAKLEAALTAHDARLAALAAGKADQSTADSLQAQINQKAAAAALTETAAGLQAQISRKVELAAGAYAGDDRATRHFSLGFAPKMVYLCNQSGVAGRYTGTGHYVQGGLALRDFPLKTNNEVTSPVVLELTDTGFTIRHSRDSYPINSSLYVYHYFALS